MAANLGLLLFGGGFFVFMLGLALRLVFGSQTRARPARGELPDPREGALAILNERYARGEIDRDEYLERRAFIE